MLLDFVKVFVIKNWNFKVTAYLWPVNSRRAELRRRVGQEIIQKRIDANFDMVRRAVKVIGAVNAFEDRVCTKKKSLESAQTKNSTFN